jgi:hypothetical protein
MKKIYLFLLIGAASYATITLSACNFECKKGSGKEVTESRKVGKFSKIDITGGYKVVIKQDTTSSLSITADDNLMQYIQSDVSGDKLTVSSSHTVCSSGMFILNISLRDLSSIKASDAVDIASDGKITTKDLEINLSGATKVTLNLNADNVTTHGTGVTVLNLTGQASSHTVELKGSGELDALDFVVAKYRIKTEGASNCKINVLNQLDVNSSGASDIQYRGNPTSINNNKSGASTLKKID